MKRLERRALICLTLAAVLLIGIGVFVYRFVADGHDWATFYANQSIYSEGRLNVGRVLDVNGTVLCDNTKEDNRYNEDSEIRKATVHAVGDMDGNISTGALSAYADKIVGYNVLTGTYSMTGKGTDINLTIDADVCKAAYEALAGRKGTVGVYNYETGEIICMVSSPAFDPADYDKENAESGMYLNKFLSSRFVPGSIFKLVTSAAAIENVDGLDSWSYTCSGSSYVDGELITCVSAHGTVDFYGALAKSCNCAYAELTQKVGSTIMREYVRKLGLTTSYDIDGISNAKGKFKFSRNSSYNLAWAGIGQYEDMINPCSMMVYMGAIANDGVAVHPKILHKLMGGTETERILEPETAQQLTDMMKNNVKVSYYESNFPGLDIYAKSGTAEVAGNEPHAWFSGFIKNEDNPYAFIICVENGGFGSSVAAPVANQVLQAIVNRE